MKPKRYTEAQVLCGLHEEKQLFTAIEDHPFDADTRIDTYMKADESWKENDLDVVFFCLERFFGFRCSRKEWLDFMGNDIAKHSPDEWLQEVLPNITFGKLARFIADRAPAIASFDPVSVLGRQCAPAGVFLGIQEVADSVTPGPVRFPPSDRIIEVMRGHRLDRFWSRLRWMTEDSMPELPAFWKNVTEGTVLWSVLAVIGALVAAWATSNPVWIVLTVLGAVASYLAARGYKWLTNPLPPDIVTFRDLAKLVASNRSTATAH